MAEIKTVKETKAWRIDKDAIEIIQDANDRGSGETTGSILEAFAELLKDGVLVYKDRKLKVNASNEPKTVEVEKIVEKIVEVPAKGDSEYNLKPLIECARKRRITVQSLIDSMGRM